MTDEIYEHLVYGGRTFSSMPAVVPELAERCVVINGVAKTYAMTGWRVGWLIAPPDVAEAVDEPAVARRPRMSTTSPSVAALAALTGDLEAVAHMREVSTAGDRPSTACSTSARA